MRDLTFILAFLAASHAALLVAGAAQRRCAINPESARKLLHAILGSLLCTLPWLFDTAPPVLALCAAYTILLLATRHSPYLATRVSPVIHAVPRKSAGDLLFPLADALLFLTTRHDKPAWLAAMLTLTFADAAAAVVGTRYGLSTYRSPAGRKSLEGSAAFATVAFASTHLPLLLLGDTGRPESVLIALTLAIALTFVEAVSVAGLDNLFVPLLAVALIKITRSMLTEHLALLAALSLAATAAIAARQLPLARPAPSPS